MSFYKSPSCCEVANLPNFGTILEFDHHVVALDDEEGGKKLMAGAVASDSPPARAVQVKKKGAIKPRSSLVSSHVNKPAGIKAFFGQGAPKSRGMKSEPVRVVQESPPPPGGRTDATLIQVCDELSSDEETKLKTTSRSQSKWGRKGIQTALKGKLDSDTADSSEQLGPPTSVTELITEVMETESDDHHDEPQVIKVSGEHRELSSVQELALADEDDAQPGPSKRCYEDDSDSDASGSGTYRSPSLKKEKSTVTVASLWSQSPKISKTLNANRNTSGGRKREAPKSSKSSLGKQHKKKSKVGPPVAGQQCIDQMKDGFSSKPDLDTLMARVAEEEKEDARTRRHMEEMASRDWKRDFGHCFRNLYEGLAEDLKEMSKKRERDRLKELGLDSPTSSQLSSP